MCGVVHLQSFRPATPRKTGTWCLCFSGVCGCCSCCCGSDDFRPYKLTALRPIRAAGAGSHCPLDITVDDAVAAVVLTGLASTECSPHPPRADFVPAMLSFRHPPLLLPVVTMRPRHVPSPFIPAPTSTATNACVRHHQPPQIREPPGIPHCVGMATTVEKPGQSRQVLATRYTAVERNDRSPQGRFCRGGGRIVFPCALDFYFLLRLRICGFHSL